MPHRRVSSRSFGRFYDPATLKLMCDAYDAAWRVLWREGGTSNTEDRRMKLAMLIITIANSGERDPEKIKGKAVKLMLTVH